MMAGLDLLVRGVAVGAFGLTGLSIWRSDLSRDARAATLLACLSAAAWILTETASAWALLGPAFPLVVLAFPVAGFFWLFVATVFEDRPLSLAGFAPAALFVALGLAMAVAPPAARQALGVAFNVGAALLCLHAGLMILRGWRGDLVASRRSLRAAVLGFAAVFAAFQGAAGGLALVDPRGPWAALSVRQPGGAAVIAFIGLAMGLLFLQGRASLFAPVNRGEAAEDPRQSAAERLLLARLSAVMEAGAWRSEGLAIGALARELATPEHQLRRLINRRLGHRNFADFVNGYRIAAAKGRLADPAEARTTIAAIAFELGFGSLSPFNRAFRATTGATPTAWRREALLAQSSASAKAD
jgi:AraC-like DNA-binding protein